jgi:hypothetical protein
VPQPHRQLAPALHRLLRPLRHVVHVKHDRLLSAFNNDTQKNTLPVYPFRRAIGNRNRERSNSNERVSGIAFVKGME